MAPSITSNNRYQLASTANGRAFYEIVSYDGSTTIYYVHHLIDYGDLISNVLSELVNVRGSLNSVQNTLISLANASNSSVNLFSGTSNTGFKIIGTNDVNQSSLANSLNTIATVISNSQNALSRGFKTVGPYDHIQAIAIADNIEKGYTYNVANVCITSNAVNAVSYNRTVVDTII